jgi:hypothetical protein
MNRYFLIILLPAIAVAAGYIVVLRWLGYELEPLVFIGAGLIVATAILLVHRHQRRKALRRGR